MNPIEELINHRWIIKSQDKEKYYQIKDACAEHKKFFQEKLGYQIIVNPYLVKLEKLPGKAEPSMGIQEFSHVREYGFLCVVLMFLEDKSAEDQFILSQLTEYVQMHYEAEKIEWTSYANRKSLVKVIRFCIKNGLIKVTDGEEDEFIKDAESEVLYESTGVSRYFMRNLAREIGPDAKPADFEKSEWVDAQEDRGIIRRQRVYRRLLTSLAVYRSESEEDEDFLYIKNTRNTIIKDFDEKFGCDLHIHKSSAFLVAREDTNLGRAFPENNNLSDISLVVLSMINIDIRDGLIPLSVTETTRLTRQQWEEYIRKSQEAHNENWGKTYREQTVRELSENISEYLREIGFAEVTDEEIILLPLAGRFTAGYRTIKEDIS